jgi:hypothetical protein
MATIEHSMKYGWRVLLASQFAIMALFLAPFPFAGLLFQAIGFIFNKRIILIEATLEIPLNNLTRPVVSLLLQLVWDLPVSLLARSLLVIFLSSVYLSTTIIMTVAICSSLSFFLKRMFRRRIPDIWAMIQH